MNNWAGMALNLWAYIYLWDDRSMLATIPWGFCVHARRALYQIIYIPSLLLSSLLLILLYVSVQACICSCSLGWPRIFSNPPGIPLSAGITHTGPSIYSLSETRSPLYIFPLLCIIRGFSLLWCLCGSMCACMLKCNSCLSGNRNTIPTIFPSQIVNTFVSRGLSFFLTLFPRVCFYTILSSYIFSWDLKKDIQVSWISSLGTKFFKKHFICVCGHVLCELHLGLVIGTLNSSCEG